MALIYPPKVGQIFECQFPECLSAPEMIKKRLVIVISPALADRDSLLVNVVPISMTPPPAGCLYHLEIPIQAIPPPWHDKSGTRWAKCDMVYTLSTRRLSAAQGKRNRAAGGKRVSYVGQANVETIQRVRRAVAHAMGIDRSLWPP